MVPTEVEIEGCLVVCEFSQAKVCEEVTVVSDRRW